MAFANEPVLAQRHLTDQEKAATVADWLAYRDTCRGPGGHGFPDPPIFPLTDALNALPGVCTTQSCSGHVLHSTVDGQQYIQPAHLWLRLSEAVEREAVLHAHELVAIPSVESASLCFKPWGNVFEVVFGGEERGTLDESVAAITAFFERGAAAAE